MDNSFLESHPELFPLIFIGMWFFATTMMGFLSGWATLAREFPDRDETALLRLRGQSGAVGIVSMGGILDLSVCPSGLRVGMLRIFGPFCRRFFVPWSQIRVERRYRIWGNSATLRFGPSVASLRISADVADRLARAAQGKWPEASPIAFETKSEVLKAVLTQWAFGTIVASLFFIVGPRIAVPGADDFPPIALAILFPAIVFGIPSFVRYRLRIRHIT